ncbi:hypothetical protein NDU88_005036 [Pleurodeles waltl]|uniref:Uncharacterized protein n=1 Tax=Pleurodeles waltl TaxID=8319 RepID=A0AAV7LNF7_PLEWA|nr:hypothetical protein NDU88_005036 [Pleurodeles waltl]
MAFRLARERKDLTYQGGSISFFLDFTVAVQGDCREVLLVKQQLQTTGIAFAILYAACLHFDHHRCQRIFVIP